MKILFLIVLFLLPNLLFASGFGNKDSSGTSTLNVPDTLKFSPFTCDSTAIIDSVWFRCLSYGATINWTALIYKVSDDGIVECASADVASTPSEKTVHIVFSGSVEVTEGVSYYVGLWAEAVGSFQRIYYINAGGYDIRQDPETYGSCPSTSSHTQVVNNKAVEVYVYTTVQEEGGPPNAIHSNTQKGVIHSADGSSKRHGP